MIQLDKELQNHYKLVSQHPQETVFDLKVPAHLTYFKGHFPGLPVLPAVGYLDLSLFVIEQAQKLSPESIKKVRSFKIKKPLTPETTVSVKITSTEKNQIEVQWGEFAYLAIEY